MCVCFIDPRETYKYNMRFNEPLNCQKSTFRPFYHRCSYCDIHYDVIGLIEEFDEDFRYIISKQNVTLLLDRENVAVNQKSKDGSESAAQKISKYFSMLEESVRLDLYHLYKIDFELFGYDASEFL